MIDYIRNKVSYLLNFTETVDELKSFKVLERHAGEKLLLEDYKTNGLKIWMTLFDSNCSFNLENIEKAYNLNRTYYSDYTFKKLSSYIENEYWNLLDRYEIDTWNWSNEDVFLTPSLYVYYFILKTGKIIILITSLQNKTFSNIKTFEIRKNPLSHFKNRQLVFSVQSGFYCI